MRTSPLRSSKSDEFKSRKPSTISTRAPSDVTLEIVDFTTPSKIAGVTIPSVDLNAYVDEWLGDCEWRGNSPNTIATNETMLRNLLWWMADTKQTELSVMQLRKFFLYVKNGHTDPRGRWSDPQLTKPVSNGTVKDYYCRVRVMLNWAVGQGYIPSSPLDRLTAPVHQSDQIQPFSQDQFDALVKAAQRTNRFHSRGEPVDWEVSLAQQCALRDETILWFLYDTGLRASELCSLKRKDVSLLAKRKSVRVTGKGDKDRTVYFGRVLSAKVWKYLHGMAEIRGEKIGDEDYLFQAQVGSNRYGKLNKDSLGDIFERLGKVAKMSGVRISPHTLRHTHAIGFIRAGGSQFELMERLGHTSTDMTRRYVKFAQADLEGQTRHSPADAHSKTRNR